MREYAGTFNIRHMNQPMPALPLYVTSLLLFGFNGIIAAAIPFESAVIVLTRLVLGGAFLGVLLFALRRAAKARGEARTQLTRRQKMLLTFSGFAMGASWLCLYAGYVTIGVGMTTLLYYTGPIMLMTFLHVTREDRFEGAQWLGLAAAAAGAGLAVGGSDFELSGGILIGLLSAACYAAMVWLARRAGKVDGLTAAVMEIGSAFPLVLVYALLTVGAFPTWALIADAWLPMAVLGLLNTGVGCAFYFYAVSRLNASIVSAAGYIEPISALIFSAIFLGETLGLTGWTGAALVLLGTVLAGRSSAKKE